MGLRGEPHLDQAKDKSKNRLSSTWKSRYPSKVSHEAKGQGWSLVLWLPTLTKGRISFKVFCEQQMFFQRSGLEWPIPFWWCKKLLKGPLPFKMFFPPQTVLLVSWAGGVDLLYKTKDSSKAEYFPKPDFLAEGQKGFDETKTKTSWGQTHLKCHSKQISLPTE